MQNLSAVSPNWIEVVKKGMVVGKLKDCKYYPCHFEGQDCTWCYCPFYPCGDSLTGGKIVIGRFSGRLVWSCENCHWIHHPNVAQRVLEELRILLKDNMHLDRSSLMRLRERLIRELSSLE